MIETLEDAFFSAIRWSPVAIAVGIGFGVLSYESGKEARRDKACEARMFASECKGSPEPGECGAAIQSICRKSEEP